MKRKILHTCDWHMQNIIANLRFIKDSGYTAIQLTPIQTCKDGSAFWTYYQPYDFKIGNRLGCKDDFIELCKKAHVFGLEVYVDVVLRHLASLDTGEVKPHENCNQKIVREYDYWLHNGNGISEKNRDDVINKNWGLPSLNYYNRELRYNYYYPFLDEVLAYADGIRIDMGRHFALPSEGCEFYNELKYFYGNKFVYAECIFLDRDKMKEYSDIVTVLSSEHDAQCDNTVRFFESHDTYYTFHYTNWMDDNLRLQKWQQLLSKYDNCLLFARPFDNIIFCDRMREINNSL